MVWNFTLLKLHVACSACILLLIHVALWDARIFSFVPSQQTFMFFPAPASVNSVVIQCLVCVCVSQQLATFLSRTALARSLPPPPPITKTSGFLKSREVLVYISRHVHKLHVDKWDAKKKRQNMFSRKLQTFLKFQRRFPCLYVWGYSMKLSCRVLTCRL